MAIHMFQAVLQMVAHTHMPQNSREIPIQPIPRMGWHSLHTNPFHTTNGCKAIPPPGQCSAPWHRWRGPAPESAAPRLHTKKTKMSALVRTAISAATVPPAQACNGRSSTSSRSTPLTRRQQQGAMQLPRPSAAPVLASTPALLCAQVTTHPSPAAGRGAGPVLCRPRAPSRWSGTPPSAGAAPWQRASSCPRPTCAPACPRLQEGRAGQEAREVRRGLGGGA